MTLINFDKPMTFLNTLEPFSLALHSAMVALRNEANFHDSGDERILEAAELFASILEDAHAEVVGLTSQLEQRVREEKNSGKKVR